MAAATADQPVYTVLFVCTGNTCRSPMAAAMFADKCRRQGLAGRVRVESRGISPAASGVSQHARSVLAEVEVPLPPHQPARLDAAAAAAADLIVTMAAWQRETVAADILPEAATRVRTLMSFSGSDRDVADPYGGDEEDYRRCRREMAPALDGLVRFVARDLDRERP